MNINPKTDPRQAALLARDYLQYSEMHPSAFSAIERHNLAIALRELEQIRDLAREVC